MATGGDKNEAWKEVSQIPERRPLHTPGSQGKIPQWSGGRGQEPGNCLGHGFYYWGFCGKTRQGRVNSLGLESLNNLMELGLQGDL